MLSAHGGKRLRLRPNANARNRTDRRKKPVTVKHRNLRQDRLHWKPNKLQIERLPRKPRKQQQAGLDCDRLAANPTDVRRKAEGSTFDVLRGQAEQALEACSKAVQQFPSELRYQYQLGRAYQFKDRKKALDIFDTLVRADYPAAFDNLGGMYLGKDNDKALQLFLRGRDLNDATRW